MSVLAISFPSPQAGLSEQLLRLLPAALVLEEESRICGHL